MKSGTTGIVRNQAACSFVASLCCTSGLREVFHWFRRPVALASAKCSQLPVDVPSSPLAIIAFCERFAKKNPYGEPCEAFCQSSVGDFVENAAEPHVLQSGSSLTVALIA